MSKLAVRTAMLAGGASAATYVLSDEDRRAKLVQQASAQYRIANLVRTAGLMMADYSVTMYRNQDANLTNEFALLSNTLKKAQHDQEVFTIQQWKVKDDREQYSYYQNKIAETRKLIDDTSEAMGKLSSSKDSSVGDLLSACHWRNAARLRDMCAQNRGCYIKLGQHLAMLDYVLPEEYNETLTTLLADTPRTRYSAVRRIIKEDLGAYPEELFESFAETPIASASLAQVHVATTKDGQKVAVKVQHEGLLEGSTGDMYTITLLVEVVSKLFGLSYTWLSREMNTNLPLELNFENELLNLEKARRLLNKMIVSGDLAIPMAHSHLSSKRVLTMDFEEGCYATDVAEIQRLGLQTGDVARLISTVFCEQMYRNGFCHCDPHEGNVLVRQHPSLKGRPQVVLLDHGLYKSLHENFRKDYCRLWRALVMGDEKEIKLRCENMNVGPAFTLLSAMLTMRPWDDITAASSDIDRLKSKNTKGESEMLKAYAKRYFKDIVGLLGRVDSEMLLLLKTNDCLRHLDKKLGAPINTATVVADITSDVIFAEDLAELRASGLMKDLSRGYGLLLQLWGAKVRKLALHFIGWWMSIRSKYFSLIL